MSHDSRSRAASHLQIYAVEETADTLTSRAGLALFARYLDRIGLAWFTDRRLGPLRKNKKVASAGECLRRLLQEIFIWRLLLDKPEIVILDLDVMVLDNDDAARREGVTPTYKKVKGVAPLQMVYRRIIIRQAPLLRCAGPERQAAAGGDRVGRTGRRNVAAARGCARADGAGGGGGHRRQAAVRGSAGRRPLLGLAAGASSPQAGSRSDSIYECLPMLCSRCGEPMRIIAFVLNPPVIERILDHIGEPTTAPIVLPARSPPQSEMDFDQVAGCDEWPEMDQTADHGGEFWE